jgi:hypothetical protein
MNVKYQCKIILLGIMLAVRVSSAQTNIIIFQELLSTNGSVLMTNAEFRCVLGNKLFFKNGPSEYHSFTAEELNTNVLATLNLTTTRLESQQQLLDAKNKREKEYIAALAIEKQREEQLAIQRQKIYEAQAQAQYNEQQKQNQTIIIRPRYDVTDRESTGFGEP